MYVHLFLLYKQPTACPGNCDRYARGSCKPVVNCFLAPCSVPLSSVEQKCLSGYPGFKCVDDYCGGCNRKFISQNGLQVCNSFIPEGGVCSTSTFGNLNPIPCDDGLFCNITNPGYPNNGIPNSGVCTGIVPCPGDCPRDESAICVPVVNCLMDPCQIVPLGCIGKTNIKCIADYCGTCSAKWVDQNGNLACQTLKKGDVCTASGSLERPSIPCDQFLFCNISDGGNPSFDIPSIGQCSSCVQYTLCTRDSDCAKFGTFFKCTGIGSGCTPSTCTSSETCSFDLCSRDCRAGVGHCEQVL